MVAGDVVNPLSKTRPLKILADKLSRQNRILPAEWTLNQSVVNFIFMPERYQAFNPREKLFLEVYSFLGLVYCKVCQSRVSLTSLADFFLFLFEEKDLAVSTITE